MIFVLKRRRYRTKILSLDNCKMMLINRFYIILALTWDYYVSLCHFAGIKKLFVNFTNGTLSILPEDFLKISSISWCPWYSEP